MATYDFDLITIGGGSGGVAGSRRAGSYGARVALCEERDVGGTCVHRGCIPKKLLMYGSQFADAFQDATGYGWSVGDHDFDWGQLQDAKDRELERLRGVYTRLLRDAGVHVLTGRGRLVDGHTVEVEGKRYTAAYILIATGSRPLLPDLPGIAHAITSDEALSLPDIPGRLVVVGGGYIGVELACIFQALGTQVTLVTRGPTVLRGFDHDARAFLTEELRKHGVQFMPDTHVRDIERSDSGVSVMTRAGEVLEADEVLYAIGREPNTRAMGLVEAGVKLDERGAVVVDEYSRTSVPSVFAVGDATNRVNLTPVAIAEGRAVAETLFHHNPVKMEHANVPSAVFSRPPLACVGLTEREAREESGEVDVYVSSFRPMKHTLSGRNARSMVKLVVERSSGRVLGFHMVGEDAPEILQGFAVALRLGVTKAQLDATPGIHPTAAEEWVILRERRPDPEEAIALERGYEAGVHGTH